MEERLHQFVETHEKMIGIDVESDGTARFIHHQVIELARDSLKMSQDKMISSGYFYELSENLEKLLHDVSLLQLFSNLLH